MKTKLDSMNEKKLSGFLNGKHNKTMLVVEPNNTLIYIDIDNENVTLEELQRLVDGYIEIYPSNNKYYYYIVDEEGLLKNKPFNLLAKELINIDAVGTVVMIPKEFFK